MSQESVSKNGSQKPEEQGGVPPRGRRAFGCVTWIYMATLAFLAVVSLLMMPFWIFEDWNLFSLLEGPAFFATILFIPAIVAAAVLGARTYRSEKRVATRNGTYVGTIIGWLGYAFIVYLEVNRETGSPLGYVYLVCGAVASALILYALFRGDQARGRNLIIVAALVSLVGGLSVLALDATLIVVSGAVASTIAGAAAGWTAGIGYARAGGAEMLPPGVTEIPRTPRRPRGEKKR